MSYANVRMYYEVLPTYDTGKETDKNNGKGSTFQGMLSTLKNINAGK